MDLLTFCPNHFLLMLFPKSAYFYLPKVLAFVLADCKIKTYRKKTSPLVFAMTIFEIILLYYQCLQLFIES